MPRQKLLLFRNKSKVEEWNDADVVRVCLEEDPQAFEKLVEKYRDRMFWTAYHLVLDYEDARDVAQQSFMKIWNALREYDRRKPFGAWANRITVNCAVDLLRTKKPMDSMPEIPTPPIFLDLRLDISRIFDRVAPLLPQRQRIALVLKEVEGFENDEIAKVMRCTESTVRNLLSQARDSFRKKVKELFPEYGV